MIRDLLNNIIQKKDIRQNLVQLKALLNEGSNKYALLYQIGNNYAIFDELLAHEDAKIRKNTALIMGNLAVPCFLEKLYETYQQETQLFVKSSYLKAMTNFDCTILLPDLKARLSELGKMKTDEDNKKHISEEMRILSELILDKEDITRHTFVGYDVPSNLVLLTNRNFQYIITEQLKSENAQEFNAGVMVKTKNLKEIQSLRTYGELLFMLDDLKVCSDDVTTAAKAIAESSLLAFMEKRHSGLAPFYFRIELKSMLALDKKSAFTKKLGFEVERLTNRSLINSTSNYEFELRMIENKEGNYNLLIKLYTLKDTRFSYRKNSIAASIQPVNAALMAALAKKYLKEDAQVLDPFCGVGTMLLERCKLVPANTMYGLDLYSEAINKAKENTEIAHAIIHYINRDFFDFKHDYLFDEIFTNMPRAIGHKNENEIFTLYQKFFSKAQEHLKHGAILILYSHDRDYIKRLINPKIYRIEQEYEISRKEEAYLFIIRYL
ncbi:MAG: methyltransferase protein [Herbinix sp.]|jgi:2-polyprenyl-3-methyl-5-hydroxy-6-metoxy-1,4-benzoquinol methylase|nr:methyltransferase protein [Herbinix sp.]